MRRRDLSRGGWVIAGLIVVGIAACGGGGGGLVQYGNQAAGTGAGGGAETGSNPGYDSQYRQQASGQTQIVHEQDIAGLPAWQEELLNDPGWNQPGFSFTQPAPSYDRLKSKQPRLAAGEQGTAPDRSLLVRWLTPEAWAADHNVDEKYLVRSGSLDVHVDSVQDTLTKISGIASRFGGSVTDSSISKDDAGHHSGFVTLRVPAKSFFDAWNELGKIGELSNLNIKGEDVGQEYVSSITHMRTLMAEQATLEKMLADALAVQRSRGLGEAYKVLLETQTRLSEVTEEIQGVEDRVNALSDQITRSTITVNLTENPSLPVAQPDKFNWGVGATFNSSVRDLMELARGAVNGLIHFVVTLQWLWWLLAFFACRWLWRFYSRYMKNLSRPEASEAKPAAPAN